MQFAIDTETNGLYLRHGCQPFMVTACDGDSLYVWGETWKVNPFTREVFYSRDDVEEIQSYLDECETLIMHNSMFDIPSLERIGIHVPLEKLHDTLWQSHVWNSSGPHGLKPRCQALFRIPSSDEQEMDETITHARSIARSINLAIRKHLGFKPSDIIPVNVPPFIQLLHSNGERQKRNVSCYRHHTHPVLPGSEGAKKSDMWLPRSILMLCEDEDFRTEMFDRSKIDLNIQKVITDKLESFSNANKIKPRWGTITETYAGLDAERTSALSETLSDAIQKLDLGAGEKITHDILPSLVNIHRFGVSVSRNRLQDELQRFRELQTTLHQRCIDSLRQAFPDIDSEYLDSVNFDSSINLPQILFGITSRKVKGKIEVEPFEYNFQLEPTVYSKKTGLPSTAREVLETFYAESYKTRKKSKFSQIRETFLRSLLLWRKVSKAITYLKSYSDHLIVNRLHSNIHQTGTQTTRGSSDSPNQQNVGKATPPFPTDPEFDEIREDVKKLDIYLRRPFGPAPAKIVISDFKRKTKRKINPKKIVDREWFAEDFQQLQLRIFAFVSPEPELIEAFRNGWNAHLFTASKVFNWETEGKPEHAGEAGAQKRIGKNVNFGYIFGASPRKIEETAGKPGLWEIVQEIYPSAAYMMERVKSEVRSRGFIDLGDYLPDIPEDYLEYMERLGQRIKFVDGRPRVPMYRLYCDEEHKGVNYIIQGIEGLIVKRAWRKVEKILDEEFPDRRIPPIAGIDAYSFLPEKTDAGITLQVHDEFVFDLPVNENNFTIPRQQLGPFIQSAREVNANWRIANRLKLAMEEAGSDFGIETPVNVEHIPCDCGWNGGEELENISVLSDLVESYSYV